MAAPAFLNARDARASLFDEVIRDARRLGARAIAWISTSVPGSDKQPAGLDQVFLRAVESARERLPAEGTTVEGRDLLGPFAALFLAGDPAGAKRTAVAIEEDHRARRLIDIDVYDAEGVAWDRGRLRLPQRRCLVCDEVARECIRLHRHTPAELAAAVAVLLAPSLADALALCLVDGARNELALTPKPGLVDQRDNGSHPDLTYSLMSRSIALLPDYFDELLALGRSAAPIAACIEAGRRAEHRMLEAIGANAHRGYIFLSGLLLLAACEIERSRGPAPPGLATEPGTGGGRAVTMNHAGLRTAVRKVAHDFFDRHPAADHGTKWNGGPGRRRHGTDGIRGEALAGLPSVFDTGLPAYAAARRAGCDPALASYALLGVLMQRVEDTTAISRCGPDGLARLKRDGAELARLVASAADPVPFLEILNDEYRRRRLTMGGVADCMAVVFAFHQLGADPSTGGAI